MHAAFRAPNKRQPINEWPYYVAAGTHQRRGVFCRLGTLSGVAKESRWQEGILTCFCVLGWCGHACTLQYYIFVGVLLCYIHSMHTSLSTIYRVDTYVRHQSISLFCF